MLGHCSKQISTAVPFEALIVNDLEVDHQASQVAQRAV